MIKSLLREYHHSAEKNVRDAEPRLCAISLVGLIGFPLYYLIWKYWYPQPYENLGMRLIGSALFLLLLLKGYWPGRLRPYLPILWMGTLMYTLPFFFSYMMLMNEMSVIWMMSFLVALFFLVLLVNWFNVILLAVLGHTLAWIAYAASVSEISIDASYLQYVPIFLFMVIASAMLNYHAGLVDRERKHAILVVASNLAHELRTPLLAIRSGAIGVKKYLPVLIDGYLKAKDAELDVGKIRGSHIETLKDVMGDIERETEYSNVVIDIILMNSGGKSLDKSNMTSCSINACIENALSRYPFQSEEERALVDWDKGEGFVFKGVEVLVVHILFNLIKNSLFALAQAGKGDISIRTITSGDIKVLEFVDTATGMASDVSAHVFEAFYSSKSYGVGAGMGLAFCKMAMDEMGGEISLDSELGSYTKVTLIFR